MLQRVPHQPNGLPEEFRIDVPEDFLSLQDASIGMHIQTVLVLNQLSVNTLLKRGQDRFLLVFGRHIGLAGGTNANGGTI